MKTGAPGSFGAQLKKLREAAGFTQEELATIAGLSVHAISAIERETLRRALEMSPLKRDAARLMGISPRSLSYYLAKYPFVDQTTSVG